LGVFVRAVVLFGVRSPISVEFEESCFRQNISVSTAVSLGEGPRVLQTDMIVDLAVFDPADSDPFYACAFAPHRRKELFDQAIALGLRPAPALVDPNAILARSVRIGLGSFVNAGVIIGAVAHIGDGVLINRAASVGHHTMIGDFVSIGPAATLAGNVRVGAGSIIGAGAVVLPDVRIGENCVIAGGALVRKHVKDNTCVSGNPARSIPFNIRKSSLWIEDAE
jgi:sugar O-acyltransferase (sialic acid O-acetyltransferase NeuD family)